MRCPEFEDRQRELAEAHKLADEIRSNGSLDEMFEDHFENKERIRRRVKEEQRIKRAKKNKNREKNRQSRIAKSKNRR